MAAIDVIIIFAFILYAVWSGLRSKNEASQNLEEYFLAGRTLPGWKAGLSMAATQFAADTPLLVTGLIATAGIFAMWRLWIYALAFLLLGFVLAPSWRRVGVITDAELTEIRYGSRAASWLRGIKAVYFGTIFNCTVLAFVLLAATRIAEPFLIWNEWLPAWAFEPFVSLVKAVGVPMTIVDGPASSWPAEVWILSANNLISILAIITVTTFYSTTGGLRSVVNTDVAQFFIMMAGTMAFAWVVIDRAGGLGAIPDQIRETFAAGGPGGIAAEEILAFTPSVARDASFAVLTVIAFQWLFQMNADGTGYLAQRSMACRSDRDAKQASLVFTVAQIFFRSLLWIPLGLGLLLLFPPDLSLSPEVLKAEREATYVRGMAELLPAGIKGLMITGMLAALASTVDTHLNWGSSYWTNDIYKRFVCQSWLKREPSPRSLVWVARGANLLILMIALVIMTQLGSIATAWRTSLLLGAGMGGILVLRWLWWRVTAWGELAAIAASLVFAPLLLFGVEARAGAGAVDVFGAWRIDAENPTATADAIRLIAMALTSTLAGVIASLTTGHERLERLAEFYRRAKPPGWWRPVADAAGVSAEDAPRRAIRGFAAVAGAAGTIFCLLTAVGSLIAGSPPPVWMPWRAVWIPIVGFAGIALIPLWWRLAFDAERRS